MKKEVVEALLVINGRLRQALEQKKFWGAQITHLLLSQEEIEKIWAQPEPGGEKEEVVKVE